MNNKSIVFLMVGISLLCLTGLILAGHGAYVKVKASTSVNQGRAYAKQHQYSQAIDAFSQSLQLSPHQPKVLAYRGFCFDKTKQYPLAIQDFSKALSMTSAHDEDSRAFCASTYYYRGMSYDRLHRDREEIADLRSVISLLPEGMHRSSPIYSQANNGIAWIRATSPDATMRDGADAIHYAQTAVDFAQGSHAPAYCIDTLAAAEARAGQFAQAVANQQRAIAMLSRIHDLIEVQQMQQRLHLYQQGMPYTTDYSAKGLGQK